MCSNYESERDLTVLGKYFGVQATAEELPTVKETTYPLDLAPIIRLDENGRRRLAVGMYGLVPGWAKEVAYGRKCYNARSETIAEKPSFKPAWTKSQRCVIPVRAIHEPCYETGKCVWQSVASADDTPLGCAGIWVEHKDLHRGNGEPLLSFSMVMMSGAGHPIFQRLHGIDDEKRMPVILHPDDYDTWLTCSPDEATEFFKQWQGPLKMYPRPTSERERKRKEKPVKIDPQGALF